MQSSVVIKGIVWYSVRAAVVFLIGRAGGIQFCRASALFSVTPIFGKVVLVQEPNASWFITEVGKCRGILILLSR